MLCPVCATEMNNSTKCPFCGHVCSPGEDNTVTLNGEVISKGHRNHWCRTTDDSHLAGKVVDGTHYHAQNPYKTDSYAVGQTAAGTGISGPNTAGWYGQNMEIQGDMMPYHPNQEIQGDVMPYHPNQEIPGQTIYTYNPWTGMHVHMPRDEADQSKTNKKVKWGLLIFFIAFWGLPLIFFVISIIITFIIQIFG